MLPRNGIPTKTNKWILAVLFSILITETTQQQLNRVDVNPAVKLTREGESITILCILPQRTRYCRIAVPGEPIRVLEPGDNVDGIEYFGEGLDRGQCGARIQRVQAKHHGEFKCFMNIGTEELVGTSQVIVGKAPQEVTLQVNPSAPSHQLNQEFFAQCTASNSRPVANLTWFLGGEPITNGVHPPQVTENADSSTIVQMFERKLRAEDDGATLVCRAEHFANDRGTQEASYQFRIQFPPQPLPNQKIEGLTLGRTGMLNVTFRANPRPTTQWQINHDSIKEGSQNGRFEATEPHNIGVGTWQVALIIADLNLEDTTQEYILKAANSEGATEYVVYIGSSDGESTAGFPIGWIILIVIICLIVVLSVVLVIVARRTGRWCFAERDAAVIPKPAETLFVNEMDTPGPSSYFYSKLKGNKFGLDKFTKAFDSAPKNHNLLLNNSSPTPGKLNVDSVNVYDEPPLDAKKFSSPEYMPLCMRPLSFNENEDLIPEPLSPSRPTTNPFQSSSSSLKPHFIFNNLNIKPNPKPQNVDTLANIFGDQEMQDIKRVPEKPLLETNFDDEVPKTDFVKTVGVALPGMVSNLELRRSMGNLNPPAPIHLSQAVPMNLISTPPTTEPPTPATPNPDYTLDPINPTSKSTDIF